MGGKKSKKEKKSKKSHKHKKKKSKRETSSSSSSSSSDAESEDSEEIKRQRATKMAKKLASRLKQGEIAGYTDQENPFGDANLTERFVWHKKIEKSLMNGVDAKELGLKAERRRHEERLKEIEKVKEQREQRDRERMEKEEEREIMQREEALIEAVELEKREEEFHLQQARMRSDIRVKSGRARAIDLLSRNLNAEPGASEFDPNVHPLAIFDGLTLGEIDELRDDLRVYLDLDHKNEKHRAFWSNLLCVADAELSEAKLREDLDRARVRGLTVSRAVLEQGLHSSVEEDVKEMLVGRTYAELEELEAEIESQLSGPEPGETEYWTAVLKRIVVHKARVAVANVDAELRAAQAAAAPREVPPPPPVASGEESDDEDLLGADFGRGTAAGGAGPGDESDKGEEEEEDLSPRAVSPEPMSPRALSEDDGDGDGDGGGGGGTPDRSFSPEPIRAREDEPEYLEVVDEEEDRKQIAKLRAEQRAKKLKTFNEAAAKHGGGGRGGAGGGGGGGGGRGGSTFDAYRERAARGGDDTRNGDVVARRGARGGGGGGGGGGDDNDIVVDPEEQRREEEHARKSKAVAEKMMGDAAGAEVAFAGEAPLESQVYWWHDKYRPRKPKYFNRVHTGYEWNKYNQTHYDHDNPPPKTVQGYKFNIFYPDLIDKSKAPSYTIIPDGSKHGETCILRIHAGPPYEDIAFKIVNKEWEYSNKKGFRCSFDRGIFHLYINFMRSRYRR